MITRLEATRYRCFEQLSSSVFKRIASGVPVATCEDGEFRHLVAQLQAWFRVEVPV